jgi:transposase
METIWAGIDWGDREHAVSCIDGNGNELFGFRADHSAEGLAEIARRIAQAGAVRGVAVETRHNLVVRKLIEAGLAVYPINPKVAKAWRDCHGAEPPKSDAGDAWVLARGLREHGDRLRPLSPEDPDVRRLGMLCADESALIAERTSLVNRLKAALKQYYPTALEWFRDWTSPPAWDFVIGFDRPQSLAEAPKRRLAGFLKSRGLKLTKPRLEKIERRKAALDWPCDPAAAEAKALLAVSLCRQLKTLDASLKTYRKRIEALYNELPDAEIFSSLPGAGSKLAPRLMAEFGCRGETCPDAESFKKLAGCVPVTLQSGRLDLKKFRRACRKRFRNTMQQFAFQTVKYSAWARAFYDNCRDRGQSHNLALRNLASKWINIIWRMWMDRTTYDEKLYIASLVKHKSPIAERLKPISAS